MVNGFGNLVTNIPAKGKKKSFKVTLHDLEEELPFYPTYDRAGEEELFLIKGSAKTFELSVKGGSAAKTLNPKMGEKIQIR